MILHGTATHVQRDIDIAINSQQGASSRQVTQFRVDGQQCTFTSTKPFALSDGDEVVVSGSSSSAGVTVYALRNLSNGTRMDAGFAGHIVAAAIGVIAGVFFYRIYSNNHTGLPLHLFYWAAFAWAAFQGVMAIRVAAASGEVARHSVDP